MTYSEHAMVRLTKTGTEIEVGAVGTIVAVYAHAYEVEFLDGNGVTLVVLTLEAEDIDCAP